MRPACAAGQPHEDVTPPGVRESGGLEHRVRPGAAAGGSLELVEPTVWEFQLREGVRFHDGTPFSAEDVVFSIERVRHEAADASYQENVRTIVSVAPVDAYTVDITLYNPKVVWAMAADLELPVNPANEPRFRNARLR